MLKRSSTAFAAAVTCLSAGLVGGDALAQLAPVPAPPRQDTLRTQDDELDNDSRAGGALSQETDPGGLIGAEEEMVPPGRPAAPVPEDGEVTRGERAEIVGEVVEVAENRLVLSVRPAPRSPVRKVAFQVADTTVVVRGGEPAELMSLVPGDQVRLVTSAGDPSIVVRIFATEELKGSFNVVEHSVDKDRGRVRQPGGVAVEHEEAVLPLGIEVYAARNTALVTEMLVGGPAENGGVRIGDLIVAINGDPISDPENIEESLAASAGGAKLTIVRQGQRMTLTVAPARVAPNALINPVEIRKTLGSYGVLVAPQNVAAPVGNRGPGAPQGENAPQAQGTPQNQNGEESQDARGEGDGENQSAPEQSTSTPPADDTGSESAAPEIPNPPASE